MTRFALDVLSHPIVQAPLAGGPSTPGLAAAVSRAGGLGFLAAGYKTAAAVGVDVADLRSLLPDGMPFGVNVFAPPGHGPGGDRVAAYAETLSREVARTGVALGAPRWDDDGYAEKLDLLSTQRIPVVSFTFGCPAPQDVERLHRSEVAVWVTVTTADEAAVASEAGADAVVVQGVEAGGHRGGFDDAAPGDVGLLALLQQVRAKVGDLALVGTGGVATGRAVAAVLAAGAAAAQLGTVFMLCPEAATTHAHREVLARGAAPTALTRAFTGRTARGVVNRFQREHSVDAPSAYPQIHHLTAPIRAAARGVGDADGFNLWAGQAYELAEPVPAAELVDRLAKDARAALDAATERLRRLA